jgi:hypothetical protein
MGFAIAGDAVRTESACRYAYGSRLDEDLMRGGDAMPLLTLTTKREKVRNRQSNGANFAFYAKRNF